MILLVYVVIALKPADAANYAIDGKLSIPEINLVSDVAKLSLANGILEAPDTIAGSYSVSANKTLIIGHSTTVFENLKELKLNDDIFYGAKRYKISNVDIKQKSSIHMSELLAGAEKDTLVLMTCAGTLFDNGDATHRLIISATQE